MSTKRPYIVTVEVEYMVLAESEAKARDYARTAVGDCLLDNYAHARLARAGDVPQDWDAGCLIYGTDEDTTVEQAWALVEGA